MRKVDRRMRDSYEDLEVSLGLRAGSSGKYLFITIRSSKLRYACMIRYISTYIYIYHETWNVLKNVLYEYMASL